MKEKLQKIKESAIAEIENSEGLEVSLLLYLRE